ncbi:MAG: hypothetical protein OHK93_007498 [Ramalina farinacea]|uniref:Uncharacterized protein n=1 Tax=Ramalina farinacea TaxID=258253 RepID=A0AA43QMS0_9LECA|nr:hypothetical protein [Ramalina farinacea]
MALPFSIPTVTNDDLTTFHHHAFGIAPPRNALLHFPTSPVNDTNIPHHAEDTVANNDDEDDLGFYQDGKKRTLTDEQVAMFRHSEIYGIVRARQVRRENEEYDSEPVVSSTAGSSSRDSTRAKEEEINVNAGSRDDATRQAPSRNKRRKMNRQRNTQREGGDVPSRRVIREMDAAVEGEGCELEY